MKHSHYTIDCCKPESDYLISIVPTQLGLAAISHICLWSLTVVNFFSIFCCKMLCQILFVFTTHSCMVSLDACKWIHGLLLTSLLRSNYFANIPCFIIHVHLINKVLLLCKWLCKPSTFNAIMSNHSVISKLYPPIPSSCMD